MKLAGGLLAQAAEIHSWLEQDRAIPVADRIARDRQIGLDLPDTQATTRLLYWWAKVRADQTDPQESRLAARFWLSVGLVVLGLIIGSGLSSLALTYEGRYPINVLALLGILVVLPGVFLLLSLATAAIRGLGLNPLATLLQSFNLNRWVLGLLDRYLKVRLGPSYGQRNAQGRLAFWQVTLFSQWFGVGFYLGVITLFAALLTFTDLAFGWSSTLEIESVSVHRWTSLLATPWCTWWPAAVPDIDLIEGSRIYRVELSGQAIDGSVLRGWWPFLLMTLLAWGLLPRCMALAFALWRVRQAERAYLFEHSEVVALLDRMNIPAIDREHAATSQSTQMLELPARTFMTVPLTRPLVVTWNNAVETLHLPNQVAQTIELHSMQTEADRQQRLQAVRSDLTAADGVVIFTKGWEPPLLEFQDVLQHLRSTIGQTQSIVVIPVGLADSAVSVSDYGIWHQFVDRINDAHTYVIASESESTK